MMGFLVLQLKNVRASGSKLAFRLPIYETAQSDLLLVGIFLLQLAIDYGIKFLETSAKSSINVEEVSIT